MANFTPGGSNFSQKTRTVISTNSVTFFGANSMLLTKYGDKRLTISFRDASYDAEGKRTFPRPADGDEKNSCYLTLESCSSLMQALDDHWIPTFNEYVANFAADKEFNKETSIAIPVNRELNRILEISSGVPGNAGYSPCIRLHMDLSGDRIPATSKIFAFASAPVFINYSPTKGDYESLSINYPQILIFYKMLEEFIKSACCGTTHEIETRYHDEKKRLTQTVNKIAIKEGVEVEMPSYGSYGNATNTVSTQSSAPNPTKQYDGDISALIGGDMPLPY